MTNLLCVIGNPIGHSLSPLLFNNTFRKLGINNYHYFASLQTTESLKDFFIAVKNLGIKGISVTIPFKTDVLTSLDEVSENAKAVGAVNTIVNKDGVLYGDNTDLYGILDPLKKAGDFKGKKIGILGAGGASLAAIRASNLIGAETFVFNRSLEKAKKLEDRFPVKVFSLNDHEKLSGMDVIINTTSVGMSPNIEESPIPSSVINKNMLVFDAVYRPKETKLIKDAISIGAKIVTGDLMFVEQAKLLFFLYTGQQVEAKILAEVLDDILK